MTKHIAVVNHQLGTATILGIMLERSGFTVLRIDNALTALKMMGKFIPDLFVISAALPGIDGIELCRRIRLQPCSMQIPIIMLAARGDLAEIEQSFEAGADDCLIQPVLRHDLLTAVQRVLRQVEHKQCTTIDCVQA